MGQGRRLRQRGVKRGRWRSDRHAQWAVHGLGGCTGVIITLHHQLHAASAGTDQIHPLRFHEGSCNGHAYRQRKPHQHEAGKLDGVTKLLHAEDYHACQQPIPTYGYRHS
jgi:hypothetical protein